MVDATISCARLRDLACLGRSRAAQPGEARLPRPSASRPRTTTDASAIADRRGALARVEAEQLRRARREQLDHPVERDPAFADAEVVDHLEPVLKAGAAVRDLREVVAAERLLAVPQERAVVGRDRGEDVR